MSNTLPVLAIGFAALGAIMQPSAARAATSDDELWIETGIKGDIAPGTDFKLELETRRRDGPNEARASSDSACRIVVATGCGRP